MTRAKRTERKKRERRRRERRRQGRLIAKGWGDDMFMGEREMDNKNKKATECLNIVKYQIVSIIRQSVPFKIQ